MAWVSKPISEAIRGGELLALQRAILTIAKARQGFDQGVLGYEDIDSSIDEAVALLPVEMAGEYWPTKWDGGYTQKMTETFSREKKLGDLEDMI